MSPLIEFKTRLLKSDPAQELMIKEFELVQDSSTLGLDV